MTARLRATRSTCQHVEGWLISGRDTLGRRVRVWCYVWQRDDVLANIRAGRPAFDGLTS